MYLWDVLVYFIRPVFAKHWIYPLFGIAVSLIYCASCAQILCDPDAGRLSFSSLNAMLIRSTLSDVVRYAQLTIDECAQFFVREACRISGNFAIFCKIFAPNLRDLDAGLARHLALERT